MKTVFFTDKITGEEIEISINFEGEFSDFGGTIHWEDEDGIRHYATVKETSPLPMKRNYFDFLKTGGSNSPNDSSTCENKSNADSACLTLKVDIDCKVSCDGDFLCQVDANKVQKELIPVGQHLITIESMTYDSISVDYVVDAKERGKNYLLLVNELKAKEQDQMFKKQTSGTVDGHEWVQLWQDGPKFAKENIGKNGLYVRGERFPLDTTGNGRGNYDRATAEWGANWRMPTSSELEDMLKFCKCTWHDLDGECCLYCNGQGEYQLNSIALQAGIKGYSGGSCIGLRDNSIFEEPGVYGAFDGPTTASAMLFNKDDVYFKSGCGYSITCYIRPVLNECSN